MRSELKMGCETVSRAVASADEVDVDVGADEAMFVGAVDVGLAKC